MLAALTAFVVSLSAIGFNAVYFIRKIHVPRKSELHGFLMTLPMATTSVVGTVVCMFLVFPQISQGVGQFVALSILTVVFLYWAPILIGLPLVFDSQSYRNENRIFA